jgi:hypothetical protein
VAGSAALNQQLAGEHGESEQKPCADAALLVPLKRSREYGAIRPRVADLRPVDSWQEDNLHFFVFQLRREDNEQPAQAEAPVAVFAMQQESKTPFSAVVVTPSATSDQAEIKDLRQIDRVYTAGIPA